MNPKPLLRRILALTCITSFSFIALAAAQSNQPVRKKIIELGWDKPDTATLRANLKEMEKAPFNGVVIGVTGKDPQGNLIQVREAFANVPWEKAWFQSSIDDLKAVHSDKLTDNFIQLTANPGNVDWFDDAGWRQIVEHWRIAAWIAREGNLKGICFDAEPYKKPFDQMDYFAQANKNKYSFEEYQAKARQRGREVIDAVASVSKELVILTLYMNSANGIAGKTPDPQSAIQLSSFNLYPSFIDGWLDVAPATMPFVDGTEMDSYYYNHRIQYFEGANSVRNDLLNLVAPENRAKYRAQVQASFGFYLDAYVNPPSSPWHIKPGAGLTRAQQIGQNIQSALDAADEYVWIYGEKYRWWPTANPNVKPENWNDVIPGINDAFLAATQPDTVIGRELEKMQQNGTLNNLFQNGNFSALKPNAAKPNNVPADWKSAGSPAHWSTWQPKVGKGTFTQDPAVSHTPDQSGSARIAGAIEGCFIQAITVKPGETYIIQARYRNQGRGVAFARVRWMTPDGKWTNLASDVMLMGQLESRENAWKKAQGKITVPEGSGKMLVMLYVKHQQSPQDIAWFDDVEVYKQ